MRQAVVIIHGIGEQRPMQTLRGFVSGVFGGAGLQDRVFSKPDRISDTLELRRLAVSPGEYGDGYVLNKECETDFYELYWQHLMSRASWRPVLEWGLTLLLHPRKLNSRLRRIWNWVFALIATLVVAIIVLGTFAWPALRIRFAALWVISLPALASLFLLGWRLLKWMIYGSVERFVLGFVGDAVRYLNPDPPNVEVRRAIRTAGLTLLRGLHEDELRRYERIILVGHSLGSVIAYDLITWFWQEQHHRVESQQPSGEHKIVATFPAAPSPAGPSAQSPLEGLGKPQEIGIETFRARQRALWQSERDSGLPWRITDLVTLGSPLAHADVLLADGNEALAAAMDQREFPGCPPSPEDPRDAGLLWRVYGDREGRRRIRILHHGAPFAVTRWTNLHFSGDRIGGQVSHLFGEGIKEVPLCSGPDSAANSWRSHVRYWDPREKKAVRELWDALNLNETGKVAKAI